MFDHNQALLPYAEQEDFENLDVYLASRPTQIGEDFNEIAHALLTPEIQNIYGASLNLSANTLALDSWGKKLTDMKNVCRN